MDEYDIQDLYSWIDELPLSRPKRHIARDFSDGVLAAEIVKHFVPRLVDLHNYQPANSSKQKVTNWTTLNSKVFKKIGLTVPPNVIQGVAAQKPGVIEVVLNNLRLKLQQYLAPPRARTEVHDGDDAYDSGEPDNMYGHSSSPRPHGDKKRGATLPPLGTRARTMVPKRKEPLHNSGSRRDHRGSDDHEVRRDIRRVGGRSHHHREGIPPHAHDPRDRHQSYEDVVAELDECREEIAMMHVKVEKLTRLVHLKDQRIEDLQRTLRSRGGNGGGRGPRR